MINLYLNKLLSSFSTQICECWLTLSPISYGYLLLKTCKLRYTLKQFISAFTTRFRMILIYGTISKYCNRGITLKHSQRNKIEKARYGRFANVPNAQVYATCCDNRHVFTKQTTVLYFVFVPHLGKPEALNTCYIHRAFSGVREY